LIVTIELIVPDAIPDAVNAVVDLVLRVRSLGDVPDEGGKLSNTKAGIVKCWSLLFALQINVAKSPVIWTVLLGSPPVHVKSRPWERSTVVMSG